MYLPNSYILYRNRKAVFLVQYKFMINIKIVPCLVKNSNIIIYAKQFAFSVIQTIDQKANNML